MRKFLALIAIVLFAGHVQAQTLSGPAYLPNATGTLPVASGGTGQTTTSSSQRAMSIQDRLVAVTDKTGMLGGFPGTQLSSASISSTFRTHLHASSVTGFYGPQLIYCNCYLQNAGEDIAGPNSITIKAVMAVGSANYSVSCGGSTAGTSLSTGAFIVCDPVGVSIAASADVYVCTYVTVTSGNAWPVGRAMASSTGGEGSSGANGADDTGACAAGTGMTSGGYAYGPYGLVGHQLTKGSKSVGFVGDSIAAGAGANFNTASGLAGYLETALTNNVAWLSSARSSDQAAFFNLHGSWRLAHFAPYINSVISELGTNDLYTAANSAATVETALGNLWTEFANRGITVFQTTLLPRTSSTDLWATVANQTKSGSAETNRVTVNDYIRTNPAPLSGYFDAANTIEVNSSGVLTQDGGYWPAALNGTTTGNTHTSTTVDNIAGGTSGAGWTVGEAFNCSGCSSGTTISVINSSTQVTLSTATSSSLTGTTLVIGPATYDGIHPSQTAVSTIAASINVSSLK
jgi:hypothetical protein